VKKKSLRIRTDGEDWIFRMQIDNNFKRSDNDENDELCLFYKIDKCKENFKQDWTTTYIECLKIEEWNDNIKYFTFLLKENELLEIPTSPKAEYKGKILLHKSMKGKIICQRFSCS